jgi:ABC-2 type transport system ATP-binding protein
MTISAKAIINTNGLCKKYGEFTAVDNLNLFISEGEIFGLLGPNGSGKTTIILMLLGLTEPTSGTASVFGFDPVKEPFRVKRLCGYLPEKIGFYENLTAGQNLRYFARLNGMPQNDMITQIDKTLHDVGLGVHKDTKVSKFSKGMKQRLGLANVLFKEPRLIILDEPTQGIDPKGIEEILDLLTEINNEVGTTILLSSHLIHHVQQICDNIGIMAKGRMRKRGKVKNLEDTFEENWIIEIEVRDINESILRSISELPDVRWVKSDGNMIFVECQRDIRSKLSLAIISKGGSLMGLRLVERTLGDIYKMYSEVP